MRRLAKWAVLGLFGVISLYMMAGVAGGLIGNGSVAAGLSEPDIPVGLIIGPIHTDLLLPLTPKIRSQFQFAENAGVPVSDSRAEWLIVGWGAEAFYTTAGTYADITAPAVWKAVTGDRSVMRLDVAGRIEDFSGIRLISVSPAQFAALAKAVEGSFVKGAPALEVAGFSWTDAFFPAIGGFHGLRTCNVWISEMMASAGIPFGRWTPTPYAVRLSLWRFHQE